MANELYHHGILGQKWGVRRFQNLDGSLTPQGRRRYSVDPEFYKESNKKITLNKDGSKTIPKGYILNRVGNANLDVNKSGVLYVSDNKNDTARYIKSLGPTLLGKIMGNAHTTIQHISVDSSLKMPSQDQLAKETVEFVKKNPDFVKQWSESFYSYAYSDNDFTEKDLAKLYSDPTGKDSKRFAYAIGSMLGNEAYSDSSKRYYDYLKKKGWDAIPDLYDMYTGTSESPAIVINTGKIKLESTTMINKDIMKSGKAYVKTLEKLKISDIIK